MDEESQIPGLDAWAAPSLPADFADRVIARVAQVDQVIGVELGRRSKRRWMFGTGLAAVLAIAAAIAVWLMPSGSSDSEGGNVVATQSVHLPFGDLDRGAAVVWHRSGDEIHVVQTAGAATWHVGANQHLILEAGAAVASISATNSTLRVEAKMNLSDVKVIGTTAIAAAAAALVTVVVYEGHANVDGGGKTVVVNPGNSVTIEMTDRALAEVVSTVAHDEPPVHRITTDKPAEVTVIAGDSVTIHDPTGWVSVAVEPNCPDDHFERRFPLDVNVAQDANGNPLLSARTYPYSVRCKTGDPKLGEVTVVADDGAKYGRIVVRPGPWDFDMDVNGTFAITGSRITLDGQPLPITPSPEGGVFNRPHVRLPVPGVLAVLVDTPKDGKHVLVRRAPKPEKFDFEGVKQLNADMIHQTMETAKPRFVRCAIHSKVNLAFTILPAGTVDRVTATSSDKAGATCAKGVMTGMKFPKAQKGIATTFALDPPCTPDLIEQGTQEEGRGDHAAALATFEQAYSCKPDSHTLALTFMTACNKADVQAARTYWKKMPTETRTHFLMICLHNHITQEMLDK
jgi:hypothetical protein